MDESTIYQEMLDGIKTLNGKKLRYIADPNKIIEIERIDFEHSRIEVLRGESKLIKIHFERFRLLAESLAAGNPIHVDTVFNSGGNDRTLIETIVSYLPKVGYMRGGAGNNKNKNKVIQWFSTDIHPLGVQEDVSDRDLIVPETILAEFKNDTLNNSSYIKAQFKIWLKTQGLSERTVKSYADNSINVANEILKSVKSNFPAIYDVNSSVVISEIIEELESNNEWQQKNANGKGMYQAALNNYQMFCKEFFDILQIPKPFLLLAGISGTGKTRFVRQQAEQTGSIDETYCLVPVRPDWHDPSDLLGYVSRLGKNGSEFIVTDVLRFIVRAWKGIITDFFETESDKLEWVGKPLNQIKPYWLCLDEMNLAPVEQYFSDYLSILETRKWQSAEEVEKYNLENHSSYEYLYKCDPLLKKDVFSQLNEDGLSALRTSLDLVQDDKLWKYFLQEGISLPFNLIVAGTVNMDETTHGFSRKVIDRAMTIDFGEFFPNDFDNFFKPKVKPKKISYSVACNAGLSDLNKVQADPDGKRTLGFMKTINEVLKDSPFELAFRSFNELLLMVTCFSPETEIELQAVWDDFLMCKVLPRIEGDYEKLAYVGSGSDHQTLLMKLFDVLKDSMGGIWYDDRPDLLQASLESDELMVKCRSKKKIHWMQHRLETNSFTSFWP